MNQGQTVFSQLIDYFSKKDFGYYVKIYWGNHKVKYFSFLDLFYAMAFVGLAYRKSLRDIEACMRSQYRKLYHMGFRSVVARNMLSKANEKRDWRIYIEFAQILIHQARDLYRDEKLDIELEYTVYALPVLRNGTP